MFLGALGALWIVNLLVVPQQPKQFPSQIPISQYAESICAQTFDIAAKNQLNNLVAAVNGTLHYRGCEQMQGTAQSGEKTLVITYVMAMSHASRETQLLAHAYWDFDTKRVLKARWEKKR